ncbi:DNA polymerase-3 subunit gamma/tau [Roseomonas rosea]|uniref:DNA polymerase-3 subunit gamma/tau n=1 Tax=Muricoccus roseus TaxID=198092 RepID=A0A1M6MSI1_9PROT|nr:hypothetical protein [Roseomonas rosea]SHJ86485.1 DNA polymerase-3 subunit gamma/tau [Roseomonas rosea]
MTKTILKAALLPSLALMAACTAAPPPPPAVAPPPEEAFRPVCQQRFANATEFGLKKCMFEELDRSRGATPASAAPAPEPAPAPAPSRSAPASRRAR